MKKSVVLFNLETNEYLAYEASKIVTTKKWQDAKMFDTEDNALKRLNFRTNTLIRKGLMNWCTRTFYSLGKKN